MVPRLSELKRANLQVLFLVTFHSFVFINIISKVNPSVFFWSKDLMDLTLMK